MYAVTFSSAKRILAFLLCIAMLTGALVSCATPGENENKKTEALTKSPNAQSGDSLIEEIATEEPDPFDPSKVIKPEDPDAPQEKRGSFSGGKMS